MAEEDDDDNKNHFPTWLIILICVLGVALITGAALLSWMINRSKNGSPSESTHSMNKMAACKDTNQYAPKDTNQYAPENIWDKGVYLHKKGNCLIPIKDPNSCYKYSVSANKWRLEPDVNVPEKIDGHECCDFVTSKPDMSDLKKNPSIQTD